MQSSKKRTLLNICIAAGITAVIMLQIAALFDYYFDLNDDVLMKDLLSGSYTGSPEAHNIQMLYPISAMISLLYRLFRHADVYGIFLCLCQYGSMFLLFRRTLDVIDNKMCRLVAIVFEVVLSIGCIMGHFVYVQYTFTVAMMAGTAAFLVITGKGLKNRILVCLIIWLSFLVRSEMLLLMLPIAGMAWGYRFIRDLEDGDKKKTRTIYVQWAIVLFLGLVVCKGIDIAAYSFGGWPEFRRLFDARTELYDYQTIPEYEGNEAFYDSIGLDEAEVELLFNYNFGLDEEIDSRVMGEIAAYARSIKEETPMTQRIRTALSKYIYRLHHFGFQEGFEYPQTDAPWNFIILILYMIIIFAAVSKKKSGIITVLYLAVLFILRSLLWMYILVGERDPIRVTHGLMFAEIMLLLGIVVRTMSLEDRKLYTRGGLLLLIVLTLVYIPNTVNVSKEEARQRSIVNSSYEALYDYMDEHSQNFYWIDVYSSVSYSEKMFTYVDNGIDNYDILGGWACKSPLQVEKLDAFGYKDIQSSLLTDNSYLVISSEYSTDWLVAYYNDKGIKIVPNEVDVVGGFKIMKISEETE